MLKKIVLSIFAIMVVSWINYNMTDLHEMYHINMCQRYGGIANRTEFTKITCTIEPNNFYRLFDSFNELLIQFLRVILWISFMFAILYIWKDTKVEIIGL